MSLLIYLPSFTTAKKTRTGSSVGVDFGGGGGLADLGGGRFLPSEIRHPADPKGPPLHYFKKSIFG